MKRQTIRIAIAILLGVCVNYQAGALGPEMIGKPAPGFSLSPLEGGSAVSVADFRGRVVVIDFWASWCAPCKRSLPQLVTFTSSRAGVKLLAVTIDDEKENAVAFLRRARVSLSSLHDRAKSVAGKYDVPAMPSAVVLDKQGIVRFVHPGYSEADVETIKKEILSLL
jgi:cytochrome c biogenesis protein CcmG, thiol:disulfide interchange protein DsbE